MKTGAVWDQQEGCDCMTVDQKKAMIEGHCYTSEFECVNCPVYPYLEENENCFSEGANIERNFNILFPGNDCVNHPSHYQGKHECIDEMIALFGVEAVKAFCRCNVYKYRFRAANKNGQEDLDKADWYMDKLMELEGEADDQV